MSETQQQWMVHVGARVSPAVRDKLEARALSERRPLSHLIRIILEDAVARASEPAEAAR
jgi:hypothetical protein